MEVFNKVSKTWIEVGYV